MSADAPASVPDPVPAEDAALPPGIELMRPRRRRRLPRVLLALVGGALAVALIAGLLVWQPWSPRPVAPASLTATSPTAKAQLMRAN